MLAPLTQGELNEPNGKAGFTESHAHRGNFSRASSFLYLRHQTRGKIDVTIFNARRQREAHSAEAALSVLRIYDEN